jgi:hypothetical protein
VIYERIGLPRFYVVTIFHETRPENFYVGGERTPVGVRVLIDHIARHATDKQSREHIAHWIKRILRPYMEKYEGLHWEFHADETGEDLWMINGLVPPPGGSEDEKAWATGNVASPY